jgi:hypothetical protein
MVSPGGPRKRANFGNYDELRFKSENLLELRPKPIVGFSCAESLLNADARMRTVAISAAVFGP